MTELDRLLASMAATAGDYRADEGLALMTPKHIHKWVRQFDDEVQIPILREMDHVLKRTYCSKSAVQNFFADTVIKEPKIAGDNPRDFWQRARLLDIQQRGHSQKEILSLLKQEAQKQHGFTPGDNAGDDVFVYLDDALFTGKHAGDDIVKWLKDDAPAKGIVHIIVMVSHKFGEFKCNERLKEEAKNNGKAVRFVFWAARRYENRKQYRNQSTVLWPVHIPLEIKEHLGGTGEFSHQPRKAQGTLPPNAPFSSEEGRQLLENQLLVAGANLRSARRDMKDMMCPLGFSYFPPGFGSLTVTYRNCPNNCPLALWWGVDNAWHPLFPRKINTWEFTT